MKHLRSLLLTMPAWMAFAQPFPNACGSQPLPFSPIAVSHPVDQSCGVLGKPTSPAATRTQNQVKNNFCAAGAPLVLSPQGLIDLQRRTPVQGGPGREPANRNALRQLGEGRQVILKGFILEAHHADIGTGESVNCGLLDNEGNDIHIALGPAVGTPECSSVTAEISPHFRPDSWTQIGDFETFVPSRNMFVVNPAVASALQTKVFRFTGQLFFDASHPPCPCGTSCSPSRSSLWEIHPVYRIDVCKPGRPCNERTDADWEPFDTWWRSLHNSAPPHAHPKSGDH